MPCPWGLNPGSFILGPTHSITIQLNLDSHPVWGWGTVDIASGSEGMPSLMESAGGGWGHSRKGPECHTRGVMVEVDESRDVGREVMVFRGWGHMRGRPQARSRAKVELWVYM